MKAALRLLSRLAAGLALTALAACQPPQLVDTAPTPTPVQPAPAYAPPPPPPAPPVETPLLGAPDAPPVPPPAPPPAAQEPPPPVASEPVPNPPAPAVRKRPAPRAQAARSRVAAKPATPHKAAPKPVGPKAAPPKPIPAKPAVKPAAPKTAPAKPAPPRPTPPKPTPDVKAAPKPAPPKPVAPKPVTPARPAPAAKPAPVAKAPAPVAAPKTMPVPAKPAAKPGAAVLPDLDGSQRGADSAPKAAPASPTGHLGKILGADISSASRLDIPDGLPNGRTGVIVLSLPNNFGARLKDEAARLGLSKEAQKADVRATLTGAGYNILPTGAQIAPVTDEPIKFSWLVSETTDSRIEKTPLRAEIEGELRGGPKPQSFPLAAIGGVPSALDEAQTKAAAAPLSRANAIALGAPLLLIIVALFILGRWAKTRQDEKDRKRAALEEFHS